MTADRRPSMPAVLAAYGVPGRIRRVDQVGRAWSNRVFRVITDRGAYAVKQLLNPWRAADWKAWLEEAAAFELAAWSAGIAMPRPLTTADGTVLITVPAEESSAADIDAPVTVRLHAWVDGRECPSGPVDPEVAAGLGADLARQHALDHRPGRTDVFPVPDRRNIDQWDELVERVRTTDAALADQAAAVGSWVRRIGELLDLADADTEIGTEPNCRPMSHGDVDQKNVIITPTGPVLCDWDVAAPWVPRQEVARTALSLAAWERPEIARAVISGYRDAGGQPVAPHPEDLAVDLRIGLDWLVLCLERAAGLRDDGPQRRREAVDASPRLLAELGRQVSQVLRIEDWLAS